MIAVAPEINSSSIKIDDPTLDYLVVCNENWHSSQKVLPENLVVYTASQQQKNDKKCEQVLRKTEKFSERSYAGIQGRIRTRLQRKRYKNLLQSVLGFTALETGMIMQPACGKATTDFIKKAKQFDASMSSKDIYQACRNVWMLNALQMMMGKTVETTPAVFAYSLLYPLTDNFLDNPDITQIDKHAYFKSFKRRLEGKSAFSKSEYEGQLFKLIDCIEAQYPRKDYPNVYESMLWIHKAQQNSIKLLQSGQELDDSKIKDIVFQKGGTSVLADGYLVAGHVTNRQAEACYLLGVILQLLDDLQDITEDRKAGLKTIYSFVNNPKKLEAHLNQTLHFATRLRSYKNDFNGENANDVIEVIVKSCHIYMMNNVCRYPDLYSPEYRKKLESRIPIKMTSTNIKRKALIYNYIDRINLL